MDELLYRQMPHSLEAEQAVLGSMLIDANCIKDVMEKLRPEDFYLRQNREIFETIYSMFLYSKPIDGVTVAGEMERNGTYDENTTRNYLVQLMEVTPTSANVNEYADIVRDKALLRAIATVASDITGMVQDGTGGAAAVLDAAEQKIYAVRRGRSAQNMEQISVVLQVVRDLHHAGRGRAVLVGRHRDELDVALDLTGADDVRHEDEAALEHAEEQRVAVLELLVERVAHLLHARPDLLLAVEHLQHILIHHAFRHSFSLSHCFMFVFPETYSAVFSKVNTHTLSPSPGRNSASVPMPYTAATAPPERMTGVCSRSSGEKPRSAKSRLRLREPRETGSVMLSRASHAPTESGASRAAPLNITVFSEFSTVFSHFRQVMAKPPHRTVSPARSKTRSGVSLRCAQSVNTPSVRRAVTPPGRSSCAVPLPAQSAASAS